MADKTHINIELKPLIHAHHGGYRIVAECMGISRRLVEKIISGDYHLYFTNRKYDEQYRPVKFRFFTLETEENYFIGKNKITDRATSCILARVEPRPDVITHRGLVSETQFYILDGHSYKITGQALNDLKAHGFAEKWLTGLTDLKDQEVIGKTRFLRAIEEKLGSLQTLSDTQKTVLLKYTNPRRLFEEKLHANPAFLMAQIPFPAFNLKALSSRKDVMKMLPLTLQIEPEKIIDQLKQLQNSTILTDIFHLANEKVMQALDQGLRVFIHNKKYTDPVANFNVLCRNFVTAQIDCYRQKISFATSELTTAIKDYDLVFLHGEAGEGINRKKKDIVIISMDDETKSEHPVLWYLGGEKLLPQYHRFISKRIVGLRFHAIPQFEAYTRIAAQDTVTVEALARAVNPWSDSGEILSALSAEAISNDFVNYLENSVKDFENSFKEWRRQEIDALQTLFSVWYKISKDARHAASWPAELEEKFRHYVIAWLGFLIRKEEFRRLVSTIENFKTCRDDLKGKILQQMLEHASGIASLRHTDFRLAQPEPILTAWNKLIEDCRESLGSHDTRKIWEYVKDIISRIDIQQSWQYVHANNLKILEDLCLRLGSLAKDRSDALALYVEMCNEMLSKRLFYSFTFFLFGVVRHCGYRNDIHSLTFGTKIIDLLNQCLYTESRDSDVVAFLTEVLHQLIKKFETFVYLNVTNAARKSLERPSLQSFVRRQYVFNGHLDNISWEHHGGLLQAVTEGVKQGFSYALFEEEIRIQRELLVNLGLIGAGGIERSLEVHGNFITFRAREFEKSFRNLYDEIQRNFFENLTGFARKFEYSGYGKLKGSLLPVWWSYLSMAPENLHTEKYFEEMLEFATIQIQKGSRDKGPYYRLRQLCKDIGKIPYYKDGFLFYANKKYLNYDHEDCYFQLAATTKNKPERIRKFIFDFLAVTLVYEHVLRVAKMLSEYYFRSIPSREYWIEQFKKYKKDFKPPGWYPGI